MGQRHRLALAVHKANVHKLRPRARKLCHLLQVLLTGHVAELLLALNGDLGLPPLSVVQHPRQFLHLSVLGIPADHAEHPLRAQHIKVVLRQQVVQPVQRPTGVVALAGLHLSRRRHGDLVHLFRLCKAQRLVRGADHMQRAAGNGIQHPHLLQRQGQVGAFLGIPDPRFQPVAQHLRLLALRQRLSLCQLLPQLCKSCLLRGGHILPQRLDQHRHPALLPVLGHGRGCTVRAHRAVDAVLQRRQPVHRPVVQHRLICQLRHLGCLHDQALLHILARARPQHQLVQRCRVALYAPPHLVHLPAFPRLLHPLFRQRFRHRNVLIPLLLRRLNGKGIPLRLLFGKSLPLAFALCLPLCDLVLLHDQRVLRRVRAPGLLPQLPRQLVLFAA